MSKGQRRQRNVRARAEKRRWAKRAAAAALIAGAGHLGFAAADADAVLTDLEAAGFTLGPTSFFTFTFNDLIQGVPIDIDGDGQDDFAFQYGSPDGFHGILVTPLMNHGIQNEVQNETFQYGGDVTMFGSPQDLLNRADTDPSSGAAARMVFDFFYGGYIGFKFDIPGGSPYIGAVEFETPSFGYGTVIHSGYQPVPEPTGLALLGMAGLAYASRRARRRAQTKK